MPTISIATPADAALLAELGARLFAQTFAASNTEDDMAHYLASAFGEAMQRAELEDPERTTWIMRDHAGVAIGYAMLKLGTTSDGVAAARPAEVQRIYVDRTAHGTGLGQQLMAQCMAYARAHGCDVLWLGMWERNPRAIAFYEKHGFQVVGRQTFQLGSDTQYDQVMAVALD